MEDNYISNIGGENDLEFEYLDKINQLQIENEKYKIDLQELKKENLEQKHYIQDLEIESENNIETIQNQNGLIRFYKQYKIEHEDNVQQEKLTEYEEKIKSLEESITIKDKKIENLNNEIKEQAALNEKLVDVITNKEETIRKMEKGENLENDENNQNKKLEEEIDNLKSKIIEFRK